MLRTSKLLLSLLSLPLALVMTACGVSTAGNFSLALNQNAMTLTAGTSTTVTVSVNGTSDFKGQAYIAVDGLPAGVTISPANAPAVSAGGSQVFTLSASSTAAAGTATVNFSGTSGTLSSAAPLALTVAAAGSGTPNPDFTLAVDANVSVAEGASAQVTLSATAANGFTGPVSVAVSGLPVGVTTSPATISLTPGTPQTVTLAAAATAAAGTSTVTFTGTSGALTHTAATALTVTSAAGGSGDFSLAVAPATLSVAAGTSGQVMLSTAALGGFSGGINVIVTGLPSGVTVSPQNTQVTPGATQAFVFMAATNAANATATVTFTGTDAATGTLSHTATLALTVTGVAATPDFVLSVNPAALTISTGANAQIGLTAAPLGGFSGQVRVAITGMPSGVTATPSAPVLTAGLPQFVTLNVGPNAAAGVVTLTFTGTSGTLVHTATLTLTIANPPPPADYTLGVTPGSLSVAQGGSATVVVAAYGTGGYSAAITVVADFMPPGLSASPSTFTLLPGTSQVVTLTAASNSNMGSGFVSFDGTSGTLQHSAILAVNITGPVGTPDFTLSISPTSEGITQGQSGQPITVTATGSNGFSSLVDVTISGLPTGVTAAPSSFVLTPGTPQTVTLSASATAQTGTTTVTFSGASTSLTHTANLNLSITAPLTQGFDVTTYHYDAGRSGSNPNETTLTPANVNSANFGKIGFDAVDAKVDAQPLYISDLLINGQDHNVLYVVTENDSVYAFDADSGTLLWQVSVAPTGETPSDDHGCSEITPQIGITATPVIDRSQGANGTIFLVSMTKDANGNYYQRLHALDLTNGAELQGGPTTITASVTGTGVTSQGGTDVFDPGQYAERASLLLQNGTIYMGWTSHCGQGPYNGWLMAYSETTLQQTAVLNTTPNGSGGSIGMSGGGLAADASGNVYFSTGAGTFDTTLDTNKFPNQQDFGNAILKVSTSNGLTVTDYYEPSNGPTESTNGTDLGTGGVSILPDFKLPPIGTFHLLVAAGKDGSIYVLDRTNLGKYQSTSRGFFPLVIGNALPNGEYGSPVNFNNVLYYGPATDTLKAFSIFSSSPGRGPGTPTSQSATTFAAPGTTPSASANGTTSGIVWGVESADSAAAVLHAYDATNLGTELYNSNQALNSRDVFGNGNDYVTPMVANGKVYVSTQTGVAVFGLLQ